MNASSSRQPFTLFELMVLMVLIVVLSALVLTPLTQGQSREKVRRVKCASNLRQLSLSLLMYSGDHDDNLPHGDLEYGGWFPAEHPNGSTNFEPLIREKYMQDGKVWACPSRTEVLTTGANSAYRYIGSGLRDSNAWATSVSLAYDVSGNHPGNAWVNVLFIDGHVEGAKPGAQPWAEND